jgi:alkylation response protein AidB-like acyl-CoA dehydrogenase
MDGFQTEGLAMAKVLACEKAVQVADICIQIHGGYGVIFPSDKFHQ